MTGLKLKKSSPTILVIGGVIGMTAAAVMACKATTKASDILKEKDEEMRQIEECAADVEDYSEDDKAKDTIIVYAKTGVKFAKLYAPAVVTGVVSAAAILFSHKLLKKRNAALAAAYAVVDKSFKEYRKRVGERFGEQIEKELRYNIKTNEAAEKFIDEKGEEQTVKTVLNGPEVSEFARFFDAASREWEKSPEYNLTFLKNMQNYANDKLKAQGYLFLNDVYDMLDIPRTKAGQIVGWIYDPQNPDSDNFVDFGIYNYVNEANRRFINGYENNILLDFNVDGNILDKI